MNFAFVGCSLTFGEGFPEELRDQYIYDRLVSRYFDASETNFGSPGASNYKIFMRAAQALKSRKFDIVFVQWSPINRLWLSPGPETHWFVNDVKNSSFRYRDLYVSPKELLAFKNLLLLFNHDYQNLLDLIDYCSFLEILAKQARSKLVFINGCILWKDDFNNPLGPDLATCLSDYSKIILDFDNRPDDEVTIAFIVDRDEECRLCPNQLIAFQEYEKNITKTSLRTEGISSESIKVRMIRKISVFSYDYKMMIDWDDRVKQTMLLVTEYAKSSPIFLK